MVTRALLHLKSAWLLIGADLASTFICPEPLRQERGRFPADPVVLDSMRIGTCRVLDDERLTTALRTLRAPGGGRNLVRAVTCCEWVQSSSAGPQVWATADASMVDQCLAPDVTMVHAVLGHVYKGVDAFKALIQLAKARVRTCLQAVG